MDGKEKYFGILGINPTNDQNTIKKAYRRMALQYHPDKNDSPDAHYMFIQITEAYEVLSGQRRIKSSNGDTTYRPKSKEEVLKEKVAAAKARWKHQQAEEARKDAEYYQRVAHGWKWKLFIVGAIYTSIFSILLTCDYFMTGEQVSFSHRDKDVVMDRFGRVVRIQDEHFLVYNDKFWNEAGGGLPIRANYSYLFNDLRSISILVADIPRYNKKSHSSERMWGYEHFDNKELYTTVSFNSVYGAFPFLHVMFFVPLLLVIFKRPNLRFSLWRLISIWVIYPTILFFSLNNDRIFNLIELIKESS